MSCEHSFMVTKWLTEFGVNRAIEFKCKHCMKSSVEVDHEKHQESNKRSGSKGVRSKGNSRSSGKERTTD